MFGRFNTRLLLILVSKEGGCVQRLGLVAASFAQSPSKVRFLQPRPFKSLGPSQGGNQHKETYMQVYMHNIYICGLYIQA